MAFIRDELIQQYLLEEDDTDCDDIIPCENDCESDHLSIASDHGSEADAENVNVNQPLTKEHSQRQSRSRQRQASRKAGRRSPCIRERTRTSSREIEISSAEIEAERPASSASEEIPLAHLIQTESSNENTSSNQNSDTQSQSSSSSSRDYFIGKDGTKWQKNPPRTNVRTRNENIITASPGVKSHASYKKSLLDCFELFLSESIMYTILIHTNDRIRTNLLLSQKTDEAVDSARSETSLEELKAFIGLLILAGVFRAGRENLEDLWATDGTGIEIFRLTMTRNRFTFLLNHLRFDDMLTRTNRAEMDKLAPIRHVFECFVTNCQDAYSPHEYLTLDEELVAFRGRCGFRQYIPSKPAKYGIKIFALVDSKTFYTMNMEIYCGKQPDGSPYFVSNKPYDLVDRMVQCVSGTSRNITMDNFFTSLETAENLLEKHKLTIVGTLRANKTCLPAEFKTRREEHTSVFGFQKTTTLVSYVPKPKKNVYLLSTLHHDQNIDEETGAKQKPEIITFYNATKSGVDVVDKLSRTYDVCRNSHRWPLTVFFALVNHAGINAMIVYLSNNNIQTKKTNYRRNFLKKLGFALLEDHQRKRSENERLSTELRKRLGEHLGQPSCTPPKKTNAVQRCSKCPRKKDRKTKYICEKCAIPLCLEHCKFLCENCSKDED